MENETMAVLKRNLKPNPKGRYCPYLGCRADDKQQRFNLGSDRAEAERRMNRLYELWEENVRANEEEVWSPLALHFAKRIAEGKRKIEYPFQSHFLGADDPAAEYTQMVHVERERFPSLDIVPADTELYVEGLRRNERLVGAEVEHPHSRLNELGALAPEQMLPEKLVSGKLYEALDAYRSPKRK